MSEAARLRRDVGWNLVPVVLLGIVGFGLKMTIGGWWNADALGSFNLVTIVMFVFAVVAACGLQYAVLHSIAEDPNDRGRVAAIVVGAVVPVIAFSAVMTLAFVALRVPIGSMLDSPAVSEGMLWAAPGLFCFAVNKILLGVVNGLRRMRAFAVYTSIRYILIAIGVLIAVAVDLDGAKLPGIWSFSEGVLLLVLLGEIVTQVALRRCHGWTRWARTQLAFGVRGVVATLAQEVNSKLDVWMLGIATSDALVGVYSLASALAEGALQISVAVQNNVNPIIARALARDRTDEVRDLTRRTRVWFVPAMVGICALSAVMFPLIIPWLIGDPVFADGAAPFGIMMAGLALASPYLPLGQLLLMAGRPGWHTALVLAVVVVNFIANSLLIPVWGLSGAAVSLAGSIVASAIFLRILARWRIGLRI